jgi:hypothetical protein
MVLDNAKPVRNTGNVFAAFITRNGETAYIQIYKRSVGYSIDFQHEISAYETSSNGAAKSARKEIKKLELS